MNQPMRLKSARIRFFRDIEPGYFQPGEASNLYQLIWLEQGRLHSMAGGKSTLLCAGDILIYTPGQWRMQFAETGDNPRFLSILLEPDGLDLASLSGRKLQAGNAVSSLLSQAVRESSTDDSYSAGMILCALEMALLLLLRTHSADPVDETVIQGEHRIIHRAQQYVSSHARDRLSVPTVAKNADVSPSYLTALFRKHLGISPGEYIRRIKLQHSKQLIREGDLNISQIAEALSYSTVHHFSRQFKETFGITPTEYARSIR